jgi:hypothetical protein
LSRGAFLARSVTTSLPASTPSENFVQRAMGIDAEVSSGYWVVRGEVIRSHWRLPQVGHPAIEEPLGATATTIEVRYRLRPGLHVAARGERLDFTRITGSGGRLPWDAPVSRVELGAGYTITRQLLLKVAWQQNWRDGVSRPAPREGMLAVQVAAWF